MEKIIGTYNANKTDAGGLGVEVQAVVAAKVLREVVASGQVSASDVTERIDRTVEAFLGNRPLMNSLAGSGREEYRKAVVRSVGAARNFLHSRVTAGEPSRVARLGARLKGLFR